MIGFHIYVNRLSRQSIFYAMCFYNYFTILIYPLISKYRLVDHPCVIFKKTHMRAF